jgi:hypothetical protein
VTDTRLDVVKRMRREATALRKTADRLELHAEALENGYYAEATPLSGEQIVTAVCEHLQVGQEAHYRVIYEVLAANQSVPRGERPLATLLAVLSRSERFAAQGRRTGIYRRVG